MIGVAALAVVTGMVLVRLGWNRRLAMGVAGWLLTAAALVACARAAGAWGVAVVALVAMAAAFVLLIWSGWGTPVRVRRPERDRVAAVAGQGPLLLVQRLSVFLLVVPGGGAASLLLAFGLQAAVRRAGIGEADAEACFLLLLPPIWCILLAWQMMRDGPRRMVVPPLLVAALGGLLWATP
jgi:hypothetical protein